MAQPYFLALPAPPKRKRPARRPEPYRNIRTNERTPSRSELRNPRRLEPTRKLACDTEDGDKYFSVHPTASQDTKNGFSWLVKKGHATSDFNLAASLFFACKNTPRYSLISIWRCRLSGMYLLNPVAVANKNVAALHSQRPAPEGAGLT